MDKWFSTFTVPSDYLSVINVIVQGASTQVIHNTHQPPDKAQF
jgi:hypothetical protein